MQRLRGRLAPASRAVAALLAVLATAGGCESQPSGQPYPMRGEVVSLTPERNEIVIRHEPISGFMEAMTMPFAVAERDLLAGLAPGDRVEGVLLKHDRGIILIQLAKREPPAPGGAAAP